MTTADPTFRPWPLTTGGHRQTLLGYWRRSLLRWDLPTKDEVVDAAEDVRLLLRTTEQRDRRRALILVHGMGGSDRSSYMLATGRHAFAEGWSVVRANMRGAGDSEALCARLYNAGLSSDLLAAVRATAQRFDEVALAGFSLGGHLTVLTLARHAHELPRNVVAGVAVCAPLDLSACADAIARPENTLYQRSFVRGLAGAYARLQRRRPDLYEKGRELGLRTVRAFDDRITAPYGGYGDAATYYAACTTGPLLDRVRVPSLVLAANDDPIVPADSLVKWPLSASAMVTREVVRTGGHVGFFGPTRAPGAFWAAERLVAFIERARARQRPS